MRVYSTIMALAVAVTVMAQRTPTMGWSSWNTFALNINEQLIRQQADAMHTSGLQAAGYKYVNIDDGYWNGRDERGHLRLNEELFPMGMRPLVDYIHSLGLKAGIYSDAGDNTCGSGEKHAWGRGVGFAGHEEEDCRLYFDDWDFDFIKVDYCGGAHMGLDEREQYSKIGAAIKSCKKQDIVYNICRWAFPGTWAAGVADSWRTTGDIYNAWPSVKGILAENLYLSAYCNNGHYNDMDMLEVGRSMTAIEDRTHFGMWCIMASPLLIGCDMSTIRPEALELLCNKDLIALNQDPLHLQAYVAAKSGEVYVLVKDIKRLQGPERAVAFYNPSDEVQHINMPWGTVDMSEVQTVYDCFSHEAIDGLRETATLELQPHETRIFTIKGRRQQRTHYEAETAFMSQYQELRNNQQAISGIYEARDGASGGYVARWLGNDAWNDIIWRNVWVDRAGTYQLTLKYYCGEARQMQVDVNSNPAVTIETNSTDWSVAATATTTVKLRKGQNTIRLYNADAWMPDIDYMDITLVK